MILNLIKHLLMALLLDAGAALAFDDVDSTTAAVSAPAICRAAAPPPDMASMRTEVESPHEDQ